MLTQDEFLEIIAERLRTENLSMRDFIILSDLYADVAGLKKRRVGKPVKMKVKPAGPKPSSMQEVVLKLERESKNGQQHPEREERIVEENQSPAPESEVQQT